MKKYILLLALLSPPCFATSQIQIHALKNGAVVVAYNVITWNGTDEAMVTTKYTVAEAQAKFPTYFSKDESGTSKNPDRVTIIYNDDATVYKVDFQALGTFERIVKSESELTIQAVTEAATVKDDIETKTGKPIGEVKATAVILDP